MDPRVTSLTDAEWAAHAEGVRRLARALVFDRDRADDVAQEALRLAVERGPGPGGALRAWLAGVVRNLARNLVRGERHRRERERVAARPEALPSPPDLAERLVEQRRVIDAVLALEEPGRTVVILRYFEDASPLAIARRLGVPLETVRTRLRRARERLRVVLDDAHHGERRGWALALLPLGGTRGGEWIGWGPWIVGGLAVKKVLLVLGIAVALAAGAWWIVRPGGESLDRGAPAPGPGMARVEGTAQPTAPSLAVPSAPEREVASFPPPVDFALLDRDRDVHGIVVTVAGEPVGGARVVAVTSTWRQRPSDGRILAREERVHGETRSSSDGSFALRLERGASVNLRAQASGFGTAETTFASAGGRVRIVLGPPARLVVVVLDEGRRPVEGATVRFFQSGSFMVGMPRVPWAFHREGTSDGAGCCVFESMPVGVWGHVDAIHPRLGSPGRVRVDLATAGERVQEVVLPSGRTLSGRVTDAATGQPIAGAVVGAGWARDRAVPTDAGGRYAFPGWMAQDESELFASAEGYVLAGVTVGERDEIDFALAAGRVVRGRVVDGAGQAVAGASVRATSNEDPNGATAGEGIADGDGRFEFRNLRSDATYRLVGRKEGHGPGSVEVPALGGAAAAQEAGDIVLGTAHRVEGRVVDARGRPIAGLEVLMERHREWRVTDDLGRFRFTDVARGTYALQVRGLGRESASRDVRVLDEDVRGVEVVLAAGRSLEVVLDAGGAALPTAGITVGVVGADGAPRRAYPDERGRASFVVPEGGAIVRVEASPEGWLAPPDRDVAPEESEVRLSLRRAAAISGTVRRADGRPLAFAHLAVEEGGGTQRLAVTDAEGRFRAFVEPGGTARIVVTGTLGRSANPWAEAERAALYGEARDVPAGSDGLAIEAREIATDRTLLVRVVGPDGAAVGGATVFFESRTAPTDATGRVRLEDLPARPIDLMAMAGSEPARDLGWLAARATRVLPAGQEVTLAFRVGARIAGRLLGSSGPAGGAPIVASRAGRWIARAVTAADGSFSLTVDPDQDFPLTLLATLPDGRAAGVLATLDRAPAAPLDLRLPER